MGDRRPFLASGRGGLGSREHKNQWYDKNFRGCKQLPCRQHWSGSGDRPKFLLLLLGALPGVLVIRGIVHDPSVLDFGQMNRFAYPLAHANPAGLLFSMSIPLALAIILTEKGLFRGTTLGSLMAQFVGLVLTYSRGAWLASIVSLFGLSLMEHRLRKVVLAFGVTALIAFVTITPLRNRLLSVLTPSQDVAIEGRLRFMTDALTVGLEKPFFGVGYGRDRLREGVRRDVPGAAQFGFIPHSPPCIRSRNPAFPSATLLPMPACKSP